MRKGIRQVKMTQEIGEPAGIAKMVGQTAKTVALLAVHEVEPGELAAETGFAIVLQRANHRNEISALDPLWPSRYYHVMSIAEIGRYTLAGIGFGTSLTGTAYE